MDKDLLLALSDADAVAAHEDEVRTVLRAELAGHADEVLYDGIGSMLFHSKPAEGAGEDPVRVMFAAHMDEVGFLVRSVCDLGMAHLMVLGGVLDCSKDMQAVRATVEGGAKVPGVLHTVRDAAGAVSDLYVDFGCETRDEAMALGIRVGTMVTFASEARPLAGQAGKAVAGKALDDRAGLFVLARALERLHAQGHGCDLWMAATSSEEVGTRGGRTATALAQPDVFFAVDVASGPDLDRGRTNNRKLGAGPMVVCYDKTMSPNPKLVNLTLDVARQRGIPVQEDMLKGGGTDAGTAHLEGAGRPALVIGLPLRGCHGAWSIANRDDLDAAIDLVCALAESLDRVTYKHLTTF